MHNKLRGTMPRPVSSRAACRCLAKMRLLTDPGCRFSRVRNCEQQQQSPSQLSDDCPGAVRWVLPKCFFEAEKHTDASTLKTTHVSLFFVSALLQILRLKCPILSLADSGFCHVNYKISFVLRLGNSSVLQLAFLHFSADAPKF